MLISDTHSFIFFHVAKVAGISIREALLPYTKEPAHFKIKCPPKVINGKPNKLYEVWQSSLTHATAKDTRKALPGEFEKFYKFAFVRNPWDWQVSMYHFLLKEKENPRYQKIKELGSFRNYLDWLANEKKPFPKGATRLQKDMLTDHAGNLIIDRVGRFENLAEDFKEITSSLNIEATLKTRNSSTHKHYKEYYDTYSRKLVTQQFAEDIDLFEYTFD